MSVVIPARDALQWLPAALGSIGAAPGAEILVVDDGSIDGTPEWLGTASARDGRIRCLRGPRSGPSAARNAAIAEARAPLVAFLDADDAWRPGKLDAQLALHRAHPEIGFSFTDYDHVTVDGENRGASFGFWPMFRARVAGRPGPFVLGREAPAAIYAENVVGTSTVVARTDLLREVGGYRSGWGSAEDWDLWLRLALRAPVGCVPSVLADYLMHRPGNVSGQASRRARAVREIAAEHRSAVQAIDPAAVRACEARVLVAEAEAASAARDHRLSLRLRLAAFARSPSLRRAREAAASAVSALRPV